MSIVGVDLGGVVTGLGQALDGLFTSDQERAAADLVMARLKQEPHRLQSLITLAEAQSAGVFKGGWRPYIGWTCGASLSWTFVVQPILTWVLAVFAPDVKPPPILDNNLMELVVAMLGLGGMRMYEKIKGVEK